MPITKLLNKDKELYKKKKMKQKDYAKKQSNWLSKNNKRKKEEQEIKRSKESAHQQSLGKLEKASNFNSKLDELR